MEVNIKILDSGAVATHAEIINNHTDVMAKLLTIYVGLYTASGDKVMEFAVPHQLESFPIPDTEAQWEIVKPALESLLTQVA